jgi:hypothetical protein
MRVRFLAGYKPAFFQPAVSIVGRSRNARHPNSEQRYLASNLAIADNLHQPESCHLPAGRLREQSNGSFLSGQNPELSPDKI